MKVGPAEDRDDHRDERRYEDACHYAVKFSATTSSPTEREPLTSTTSPGRSSLAQPGGRLGGGRDPVAAVGARELADGDHLLDAELAQQRADLARGRPARLGAELGHLAEHRDAPACRAPRSARCSSAARIDTGFAL